MRFVASRRRILSFLGTAPLAARAVGQDAIARLAGFSSIDGLGSTMLGLPTIGAGPPQSGMAGEVYIPHEQKLIGAADFIRIAGMPAVVEDQIRDQARYCNGLDPDIACKRTWSMNVKIAAQRQRNFDRSVERIKKSGPHLRSLQVLKSALGFDWPW